VIMSHTFLLFILLLTRQLHLIVER